MDILNPILLLIILTTGYGLYRYLKQALAARPDAEEDLSRFAPGPSRSFIISHLDFDGLASAALLLRLVDRDAGIGFTTPARIAEALEQAFTVLAPEDRLYVADLPVPQYRETQIREQLDKLRGRRIAVHWIDHHQWPAGLIDRVEKSVFELDVDATQTTAAAMIRQRLPETDDTADQIIRFVTRNPSREESDWYQTWTLLLSELVNRRDFEMAEKVVRTWSSDESIGATESFLIGQGRRRERRTREMAAYRHRTVRTAANRTFLVIDVRPRRVEMDETGTRWYHLFGGSPTIMIGSLACRHHNADFCVILWEDFRYSIYRGMDREISFESLFPEFEAQGTVFRGAGHHYAASIRPVPGVRDRFSAMFRFSPPPLTEKLIRHLAERF